ncbi:MAG: hypothetical protein KA015_00805 [Spirochaetes bacterium]|nr:hypothetical protein [Spirochaetota bacterium]
MKLCKALKIPIVVLIFISIFSIGYLAKRILPGGFDYILRAGSSEVADVSSKLYSNDPLNRIAAYTAISEINADTGGFFDKRIAVENDIYIKRILIMCRIFSLTDESARKYLDSLSADNELKKEIEKIKKNISRGRNDFSEMKIRL